MPPGGGPRRRAWVLFGPTGPRLRRLSDPEVVHAAKGVGEVLLELFPRAEVGEARRLGIPFRESCTGAPGERGEADELEARCFQHEMDHLDGTLLTERLDEDTRKVALKTIRDLQLGRAAPPAKNELRLP